MSHQAPIRTARFRTVTVRAGHEPDPGYGAVVPPISTSSIFVFKNGTERGDHFYSRMSNPNRDAFEKAVAACEGAKYGIAFSSGMAASAAVLHLLQAGDHIAKIDDMYAGTKVYIEETLINLGITSTDFTDIDDLAKLSTRQDRTKLVWLETPTNPMLKVIDIRGAAEVAKRHNSILLVDNTFLSPACQRPLELGADIVLHSVSKYINGHSDVVMGILLTDCERIRNRLRYQQVQMGAAPSPFDCYLASRGLRTLALRMAAHCANALAVAGFLEKHAGVERVIYPGLASHPQHELSRRQARGFGGMITFYVAGGMAAAAAFLGACRIAIPAVSLGAVETLIEHPASMTHKDLSRADREAVGISDGLIRMSVGIEHQDDIIADIDQALAEANKASEAEHIGQQMRTLKVNDCNFQR